MSNNEINWKKIKNLFAYIALVFLGIVILLDGLLPKTSGMLMKIGIAIAAIVTAIQAFYYAKSKRHIAYMLVWAGALVLVVVSLVLSVTVFR